MHYLVTFIPLEMPDNLWSSELAAEDARDEIATIYNIPRQAFRIVEVPDPDDDYDDIGDQSLSPADRNPSLCR